MVSLPYRLRGATILETVVSFMLIFILISTFSAYASRVLLAAQEVALKNELANLRLSLAVYAAVHDNTLPRDLRELCATRNYFVMIDRHDTVGNLLDPFRMPYRYDPKTGEIRTTTSAYKDW